MSKYQLIGLYLIGWIPMIYIGMRISDRMWRNVCARRALSAYSRGWNHGYGFLQKIEDVKTEQMSGVKIRAEKASQ